MLVEYQSLEARAFNRGSDARLAGVPLNQNPYPSDTPDRTAWLRGWIDADMFWGIEVRNAKPLPPIMEA